MKLYFLFSLCKNTKAVTGYLPEFGPIAYGEKGSPPLPDLPSILFVILFSWLKAWDCVALGGRRAARWKESLSHRLESNFPEEPQDREASCRSTA